VIGCTARSNQSTSRRGARTMSTARPSAASSSPTMQPRSTSSSTVSPSYERRIRRASSRPRCRSGRAKPATLGSMTPSVPSRASSTRRPNKPWFGPSPARTNWQRCPCKQRRLGLAFALALPGDRLARRIGILHIVGARKGAPRRALRHVCDPPKRTSRTIALFSSGS
jgi:hypothetical protein